MLILGLSNMRDAAAALVENGRLIASAEEERFVRVKHVTALPVQAIRYCLRAVGVRLCDVDAVAVLGVMADRSAGCLGPWVYAAVGATLLGEEQGALGCDT